MLVSSLAPSLRHTLLAATFGVSALMATASVQAEPHFGIAMQGEPALPNGFDHFPYVDPAAPKGGRMVYGVFGSFDNLNPVSVQGALTAARGLFADPEFGNLVYEPLMQRSADEAFTYYGLIAKSVETDAERRFVEFQLDPAARFSDGRPVRPEDVLATVDLLRVQGSVRPQYSNWLSKVARVEKRGEHGVRFVFNEKADRELPLLLAALPVIPEGAFDPTTIARTTLDKPIGSGPYLVERVEPGQRIVYRRNPDYWGRDLPTKRGVDNYDEIVVEYFRDQNAQFEAFKKGITYVYFYNQPNPRHWRTAYDFPAVAKGEVVKEIFETGRPANLNAFFFNTRRPIFADARVREALSRLFDFEWVNRNLFYGEYQRLESFFDNSELSSVGRPADAREETLLRPFAASLGPGVLAGTWRAPGTDGSGSDRNSLRAALSQLETAGYHFDSGRMVNRSGQPLSFEIMVATANESRIALGYARSLARIGVDARVRQVDDAQYQKRKQSFDYDMLISAFSGTLSPGTEQVNRWGSSARERPGSFNYAGVADPAVDAMIAAMTSARTREDYLAAVRAYDRVLISGHYVIPLYYIGEQWLARWHFIQHPQKTPLTGFYLPAFWDERAED
ncbi:extracellular solute-binding protein [Aureimonas jatrophae]|uniref:Peptide/nickel transport system substrate-binding protein n=1 Tax=Aureimonas jatrophae TaxID=1166073 RepID=A0A1H0NED3_9HYPH|nr:extracellular solute-binding protein [Aureimonas jatrophae]MBB3953060.1 peptide/nickel transport system substrate-binding protein [Aureimonas jatrophae]SDO91117.1 peptide/nickel transport system substrate-binding protein [Aureimonas jatrophae]